MSTIGKIKSIVRDATQSPVIVRIPKQFVTLPENGCAASYEPGFYKLPPGQAREWIACGYCRAVTEEAELAVANTEIMLRELEASE